MEVLLGAIWANAFPASDGDAIGDAQLLTRARSNFGTMPPSDIARIAWVTQDNGWPHDDAERA
ncbi:MAG: hypothetical protein ABJE47_23250 [bacterium]